MNFILLKSDNDVQLVTVRKDVQLVKPNIYSQVFLFDWLLYSNVLIQLLKLSKMNILSSVNQIRVNIL